MRVLSAVDQLFLRLETRNQPMHIGGLFLFRLPDDADADFVGRLAEQMRTSQIPPSFPFNQILHHELFWQTDGRFDVEQHFRHIALPKPAQMADLLTYVSQEHSKLLNRHSPMWECHLIEGIAADGQAGQRFALYFKIHHALIDGIAGLRLVQKSLSPTADERVSLPAWSLMTRKRHLIDSVLPTDQSLLRVAKQQTRALPAVGQALLRNVVERFDSDYVTTTQAPDSILNQKVSSARRLSAVSFELSRFRRVADAFGVSLNDVVLAVCSGALRRYLLAQQALPRKPLIAFVPYSLRTDNSASGNQLTFILANLATHLADPVERLQAIHASTRNSKRRFARLSQSSSIIYSALAYSRAGLQILTGLFPEYRGFNLIISNVPGSKTPLYWHGAKLEALYPASVVFNDQALNITLCTYVDQMDFCIAACSKAVPHSERLLDYLAQELATLAALVKSF